MTDNEITREKTFSEELPYFKERMKEISDNYDNPDGYADVLYLSALSDSNRIVRKAEEEINRQKAEYNNLLEQFRILDCECGRLEKADENQKAEIENLTYTLWGVMHSVDKWLDGTELEQDELNRAVTMREKTLRIVEEKQAEIERLEKIEIEIDDFCRRLCRMRMLNGSAIASYEDLQNYIQEEKSEVVKEFADRLKNKIKTECNPYGKPTFDYDTSIAIMRYVDNLVKGMVGENNA